MSLAGDAARGAAATLSGQWIRFAIQLLSLAILARLLDAADFGVIAMATSIVGIATVLGDFGLSLAAIQSQSLSDAQRNNLFWLNALLGLALAAAFIALAGPIALFFGEPAVRDVTQVLSSVFLINAIAAQFKAETTRQLRFRWLAAGDVSAQFLGMIVAVAAAFAGAGYWAVVLQQVTVALVTLIVVVIAARWFPGMPSRSADMKPLIAFGTNTLGVQLVNFASSNADSILIGRVWGASALGFYDRAWQIFRIPLLQIAAPMTRVALPILSRLQGDPAFERYVQRAQLILTYLMGGFFFIAAAVAAPTIDIVLGPGWDQSKPIFQVLAIGGVFQALGYVYYWVFLATAQTALQLRFSVIGRLLMIGFMAVGVIFGPLGVAIGSTAGLVVNWLILTIFAVPRAGIRVRPLVTTAIRPFVIYSLGVTITIPLSIFVTGDMVAVFELLLLSGIFAVYLGLAALLVPGFRRDVSLIWDAVKRIRKAK